jgi:L-malate glycosyltransferase
LKLDNKKIISPMAWGNGAFIVHRSIEHYLRGYEILPYHPGLTLLPILLKGLGSKKKSTDLIHTTPDYGIFFQQKSVPMVLTFHNYVLDKGILPFSSILQKIHYATDLKLWTLMSMACAKRVTAVSRFTANLVKEDLYPAKPISVIYNGVDEKLFAPTKTCKFHDEKIRVFFSGNLTLRKGAHWLPDIAERLSPKVEIHFTQGLRTKKYIRLSQNLVPEGPVPFENMSQQYGQMDILLMPTVREGLSLAVLEAMACGLPVVASNCSSLPEQIDEGKGGFLCPVGDVDAFAEKINVLADSPNLRKEMGEYNRAKVEKIFTLDRMVREYKALFEEVMETWSCR